MKITCAQFEGLISFYMDGELSESLKNTFEEHLKLCPNCNMKYSVISKIINDIKDAYSKYISQETDCIEAEISGVEQNSEITQYLSAYIDNELPEEFNIKIRRSIIAKPKERDKLEKLYKLRKIMSKSFVEQKNKLKTDYSREIVRLINKSSETKEVYFHCTLFIIVVIGAVALSVWAIFNLI